VVTRPFEHRRGKERVQWRLSVAVVLAAMVAFPAIGWPRSSFVGGGAGSRSATASPWVENQDYDPAAAYFNSLLSFGAMSVIAPAIFGDFQSSTAATYAPQWSGVMLQDAGFDTAVSTMLNGFAEQELLPTGGALIATAFGVGSDSDLASSGAATSSSANGSSSSVSVPTVTADMSDPTVEAGGIEPVCVEDEVADKLQAGGEYWNSQGSNFGGARFAPAQFPLGVFAKPVMLANPLGAFGPTGDRTNLVAPGPAGGWCRPGREPFSLSSPLENDLLWIAFSIVLGAVLIALLSRGARLPAI
jgi:hypothetical protein